MSKRSFIRNHTAISAAVGILLVIGLISCARRQPVEPSVNVLPLYVEDDVRTDENNFQENVICKIASGSIAGSEAEAVLTLAQSMSEKYSKPFRKDGIPERIFTFKGRDKFTEIIDYLKKRAAGEEATLDLPAELMSGCGRTDTSDQAAQPEASAPGSDQTKPGDEPRVQEPAATPPKPLYRETEVQADQKLFHDSVICKLVQTPEIAGSDAQAMASAVQRLDQRYSAGYRTQDKSDLVFTGAEVFWDLKAHLQKRAVNQASSMSLPTKLTDACPRPVVTSTPAPIVEIKPAPSAKDAKLRQMEQAFADYWEARKADEAVDGDIVEDRVSWNRFWASKETRREKRQTYLNAINRLLNLEKVGLKQGFGSLLRQIRSNQKQPFITVTTLDRVAKVLAEKLK